MWSLFYFPFAEHLLCTGDGSTCCTGRTERKTTSALNHKRPLGAHYIQDQLLGSFLLLFYWILTANMQCRYCHLSFTNEETGTMGGKNDLSKIKHMVCSTAGMKTTKKSPEAYESKFPVIPHHRREGNQRRDGREYINAGVIVPLVKPTYALVP